MSRPKNACFGGGHFLIRVNSLSSTLWEGMSNKYQHFLKVFPNCWFIGTFWQDLESFAITWIKSNNSFILDITCHYCPKNYSIFTTIWKQHRVVNKKQYWKALLWNWIDEAQSRMKMGSFIVSFCATTFTLKGWIQ